VNAFIMIAVIVAGAVLASVVNAARKERQRAAIAYLERRIAEYEDDDQ
jgi:outer membrane murein-binding lipoprotein Lpp